MLGEGSIGVFLFDVVGSMFGEIKFCCVLCM